MPAVSERQILSRECWHRPGRVKRCARCGEDKPLGEFTAYGYTTKQGKRSTRYESRCLPCNAERKMESYWRDPANAAAITRRWRDKNPEVVRAGNRRRQQDPAHRAVKAMHQRLRKARMRSGQRDDPAVRAIYAEAMRIEQAIQCCPVFDIPELGKKMHVDHIMPLSRGGLHIAGNLQILPIGINMRKGTKCPR